MDLLGLRVAVRVRGGPPPPPEGAARAVQVKDAAAVVCAPHQGKQAEAGAWCRGTGSKAARALPAAPLPTTYRFAHAFDAEAGNADVYAQCAEPLAERALEFFSGALLAYGQTGSGKTHTLFGSNNEAGIGQRLIADILARVRAKNADSEDGTRLRAHMSFVEIYQENITDLLTLDAPANARNRKPMKLRTHPELGAWVDGAYEPEIDGENLDRALGLASMGMARRRTASHDANHRSSRSHAVLTLRIVEELAPTTPNGRALQLRWSRVAIVDLAGAERVRETNAQGVRLSESCAINRGLSALGRCVRALAKASALREARRARGAAGANALWHDAAAAAAESNVHIPCRESKLTALLSPCLSGLSLCSLVCCISPLAKHSGQTRHTLEYARECQSIRHDAAVAPNTDIIDAAELMREFEAMQRRGGQTDAAADGTQGDAPSPGNGDATPSLALPANTDPAIAARIKVLEAALARAEQQRSDEVAARRRRRASAVLAKKRRQKADASRTARLEAHAALARTRHAIGGGGDGGGAASLAMGSSSSDSSAAATHALDAWEHFWRTVEARQGEAGAWPAMLKDADAAASKIRAALAAQRAAEDVHAASRCIAAAIEHSVQRAVEELNKQLRNAQEGNAEAGSGGAAATQGRCRSPTSVTNDMGAFDVETSVLSDAELGGLLGQLNALNVEAEGVRKNREALRAVLSDVLAVTREADALLERASETLLEEHKRQMAEEAAEMRQAEANTSENVGTAEDPSNDDATVDDDAWSSDVDSESSADGTEALVPLPSLLTAASATLRALTDRAFGSLQEIRRHGAEKKDGLHATACVGRATLEGVDLLELVASFPLPDSDSPAAPGASAARAVREHAAGLRPVVNGEAACAWGDTGAIGCLGYAVHALTRELARRRDARQTHARVVHDDTQEKLAAASDTAAKTHEALALQLAEAEAAKADLAARLADTEAHLSKVQADLDATEDRRIAMDGEAKAAGEELARRASEAEARVAAAEVSRAALQEQLRESEEARRAAETRAAEGKLASLEAKLAAEASARSAEARAEHAEAALRQAAERAERDRPVGQGIPSAAPKRGGGGGLFSCGRAPAVVE